MHTFVGQQKPRRSIPPAPCLLHCILNGTRRATILDHLIVLSNQADVVIAGRLEPTFQPQTVVAGVHLAASCGLDTISFERQINRVDRVVPPFPVHTNHPEQSH